MGRKMRASWAILAPLFHRAIVHFVMDDVFWGILTKATESSWKPFIEFMRFHINNGLELSSS